MVFPWNSSRPPASRGTERISQQRYLRMKLAGRWADRDLLHRFVVYVFYRAQKQRDKTNDSVSWRLTRNDNSEKAEQEVRR